MTWWPVFTYLTSEFDDYLDHHWKDRSQLFAACLFARLSIMET